MVASSNNNKKDSHKPTDYRTEAGKGAGPRVCKVEGVGRTKFDGVGAPTRRPLRVQLSNH